jgi:hypothetical protein
MFYNTYPSSLLEFIVAEITSLSVIVVWADTSKVNTQKVTKMLVQVNGLFVGQVDIMDKGIKISELEPNEDYEIRIWCQIENGKFYPSRKIKISTDAYKKVEDDVASLTSHNYSEFELKSMQESVQTRNTESIPIKDSRLKALRLQVESLSNVLNSIQKKYTETKGEFLSSINKARTHFEALNLERPNLLRSLKNLEGNKKIILNQKSKLEKEVLSESNKLEKAKQELLAKNAIKSSLNGEIKLISLQMTASSRKHLDSMEKLNIIKQEYLSEIKDLEVALSTRRSNLRGLEARILGIKERISFIKHLLGQLTKNKKNHGSLASDYYRSVDINDGSLDSDDPSGTEVGDDSMEAWVDLLTD